MHFGWNSAIVQEPFEKAHIVLVDFVHRLPFSSRNGRDPPLTVARLPVAMQYLVWTSADFQKADPHEGKDGFLGGPFSDLCQCRAIELLRQGLLTVKSTWRLPKGQF